MRTACTVTAALTSIDVADAFCNCIVRICNSREVYRWMCSAAGVIPTLVSAMNNHGADSQRIAAKGCLALASLVRRICRDAEIVVECGGLDAILAVMTSHPSDADVQRYACRVLYEAAVVSQAALLRMRASAAVALINTAKVNHPTEGWDSVRRGADDVLSLLLAA